MTTRPPKLTMLIRVRRLRRLTWMCQSGRMGRMRMAMSTNALCVSVRLAASMRWKRRRFTNPVGTKARTARSTHLAVG